MKLRVQTDNFGSEKTVKYEIINRKYRYAPHIHQYAELVIPLKGEFTVITQRESELISPGKCAFIFPYQEHSYSSLEYNELIILVFHPSLIGEFSSFINGYVGKRAVFTPGESAISLLKERVLCREDFDLFDIKGCIYLLLSDFTSQVELEKKGKSDDLFRKIVEYIAEHVSEKITPSDIYDNVHYSKKTVSSVVHRIYGDTLISLINAIKMNKAMTMLRDTDVPIRNIAIECGFSSQIHFSRLFKKIVNRTPSQHRKIGRVQDKASKIKKNFT